MKRDWCIYSFYRDNNRKDVWHIGMAYYTGNRHPSGSGLETTKDIRFKISEQELINLLLNHAKQQGLISED